MAHKAPGKHHREGISLIKLSKMFPDDAIADKVVCRSASGMIGVSGSFLTTGCRH